jgi:hypothetical protein
MSASETSDMHASTYNDDLEFLTDHVQTIELSNPDREQRLEVIPDCQGRAMTSAFPCARGPSFGWLNRPFITARKDDPKFNNCGGEDRFWLGPEAGPCGLWFRPEDKFTWDDFRTPSAFNSGPFQILDTSALAVLGMPALPGSPQTAWHVAPTALQL